MASNGHRPYASQKRAMKDWLRERDGSACWICALPMNFDDCDLDEYATFDHLKCVRNGGKWDAKNLKLAHRVCNELRAVQERSIPDHRQLWERQQALMESARLSVSCRIPQS